MRQIIDHTSAAYYKWGAGCDTWVLVDTQNLSVKQEHMPPYATEVEHFHNHAQQFFYVLQGTATFYIDDQKYSVKEKQGIVVECKSKHVVVNETDEDLTFLVISHPSTNTDRILI
jgi:mannose-6-phosphate isomerase-like protein (cupin superfamily)